MTSQWDRIRRYKQQLQGEETKGASPEAVEELSVTRGELDQGDAPGIGANPVSEDGVDKDGRRTELGIATFSGEELQRGRVVLLRRHVRVLCATLPEPLLHVIHQLRPYPRPPVENPPLLQNVSSTLTQYTIIIFRAFG